MKNDIINELKKCSLEELQEKIKKIDLTRFSFFELTSLRGDIFNEVFHQLKPINDEANKKYLEMKKEEQNIKKAS